MNRTADRIDTILVKKSNEARLHRFLGVAALEKKRKKRK